MENPHWRNFAKTSKCRDTNAGSFHTVLANLIGFHDMGFVMDKTRDVHIWKQPVYGYSAKVIEVRAPQLGASHDAVEEVEISNTVKLISEDDENPHSTRFHYSLELDKDGNITGGEWLNENGERSFEETDVPDFIWTQNPTDLGATRIDSNVFTVTCDFSKLPEIYRAFTNASSGPNR